MSQFCVCDCVVRMLLQNDEWIKAVFAIQCTANKPLIVCICYKKNFKKGIAVFVIHM